MEIEGILAVIGGGGRFSYILCTNLLVHYQISEVFLYQVPPFLLSAQTEFCELIQHSSLSGKSL